MARPVLVHRGEPRLLPRPRRGSRRARPSRAAQAPDGAVRPVRPRQDLVAARRTRAAAARRGLLPGLRAGRLLPRFAAAVRADQAGDLPRDRGRGALDAARLGRGGRVALGVPAPSRRSAARCQRPHAPPAADLRPVRGDLHAGAGGRRRPAAREAVPRRPRRPRREPAARGSRAPSRGGRCRRRAITTSPAPITAS